MNKIRKAKLVRGVIIEGFKTTEHPIAKAGATLCITKFKGKLKGEIAKIGPIGKGFVKAVFPSPNPKSIGTFSPSKRRHSSLARLRT